MSRIGRLPIAVPQGVTVTVDGRSITVVGPRGTLSRDLHPDMAVSQTDATLHVERPTESKPHKGLEITGVGYRATLSGRKLMLNLGYSHPIEIDPPSGISFEVDNPTRLAVVGIDKELVGQYAAKVRSMRKPEPYKGKGVRYAGEVVRRKAGKAGKIGGKK